MGTKPVLPPPPIAGRFPPPPLAVPPIPGGPSRFPMGPPPLGMPPPPGGMVPGMGLLRHPGMPPIPLANLRPQHLPPNQ